MSIRTRILLVVLALVLVALGLLDVVSYTVVRRSLISRDDAQLQAASASFVHSLSPNGQAGTYCHGLPLDSYGALYDTSGTKVLAVDGCPAREASSLPPLPASLISAVRGGSSGGVYATLGSERVYAELASVPETVETPFGPYTHDVTAVFVVAEPLAPVNSTLGGLLILELIVTGSILLAAGAAALFLVQLGLRPLEQMSVTAGEIAAGDLSRRLDETDERTEVGRLGASLNVMLSRIESAFQAKEASERRLRQFVADASHELRTPLTSIRGYAELFRTGVASSPADVATALRRIESESERMSGLVDDLLLLARLDQGRPLDQAPVDVLEIAENAAADARVVAPGREIRVLPSALDDSALDFVTIGDKARLSQVLVNLIANAVAHTPPDSPIEVMLAATPSSVRIEVVDHGPGIPEAERPLVFDRFWRADESRQRTKGGNGLGLSIVAAVVGAHGGAVFVWETEGGGATFGVELPRAGMPVPPAEPFASRPLDEEPHLQAVPAGADDATPLSPDDAAPPGEEDAAPSGTDDAAKSGAMLADARSSRQE